MIVHDIVEVAEEKHSTDETYEIDPTVTPSGKFEMSQFDRFGDATKEPLETVTRMESPFSAPSVIVVSLLILIATLNTSASPAVKSPNSSRLSNLR